MLGRLVNETLRTRGPAFPWGNPYRFDHMTRAAHIGPFAPNVGGPTTLPGMAIVDQTSTEEREHHAELRTATVS
jgi:hypothetical protein